MKIRRASSPPPPPPPRAQGPLFFQLHINFGSRDEGFATVCFDEASARASSSRGPWDQLYDDKGRRPLRYFEVYNAMKFWAESFAGALDSREIEFALGPSGPMEPESLARCPEGSEGMWIACSLRVKNGGSNAQAALDGARQWAERLSLPDAFIQFFSGDDRLSAGEAEKASVNGLQALLERSALERSAKPGAPKPSLRL